MRTELYLNAGTNNYVITDQDGNVLTIEQAKSIWEASEAGNYNAAFYRLVSLRWDMEAVKKYYRKYEYSEGK